MGCMSAVGVSLTNCVRCWLGTLAALMWPRQHNTDRYKESLGRISPCRDECCVLMGAVCVVQPSAPAAASSAAVEVGLLEKLGESLRNDMAIVRRFQDQVTVEGEERSMQ